MVKLKLDANDSIIEKFCNKCGLIKPLNCFHNDKSKADGLHTLCKTCRSSNDKRYREANKDRISLRQRMWERDNRERLNAKYREYSAKNREKRREIVSASLKKKPWKRCAREAKRRAAKLRATPAWADLIKIEDMYRNRPEGYHVDHIIPLRSNVVCGLHCEHNLQYLDAIDNIVKSNKLKEFIYE